ncbi:hypothetical protein [Actinomadura macra]|uniref:hypothetical protein n=1 Tax=Actinomadura macra TaxID=46164 RepID=UPI00082EC412|nr:hypothetical protein [Actinomadura macra]
MAVVVGGTGAGRDRGEGEPVPAGSRTGFATLVPGRLAAIDTRSIVPAASAFVLTAVHTNTHAVAHRWAEPGRRG